jgi:GAF domain-containing protein
MYKEIRLQINRLRTKHDALFQFSGSTGTDKLLSFFTRIVTKVTDSERCSVFINDPKNNKVWLKAGTGIQEHGIEVPTEGSVVGKVISSGEPLVITDFDNKSDASKIIDEKTGFITRNILCVPIKSPTRPEITGAFELLNKKNGHSYTDDDMALAQEIAEHLQAHVDVIFLSQEIFGLSEQLYSSAIKTTKYLVGFIVILLLVLFLIIAVYTSAPWFLAS